MQSDAMQKSFIVSALGILICHSYFGIIQEKITRGRYGSNINTNGTVGDRFRCTLTLVCVECAANFLFAGGKFKVMRKLRHFQEFFLLTALLILQQQPRKDKTPRFYYAFAAISNLLSMVSSNMALRWISYPTQVIAKSAKPIPVMLLGVVIGRKSYPLKKYFYTFMIVVGVAIFMYKVDKNRETSNNTSYGQFLILFSLFMNGVTGAVQDRIANLRKPSAQHMMMWVNAWCTLILTIAILVTGEWRNFKEFTIAHPEIIKDLILISTSGAFGQFFIFMMISKFGSLPCSIVTTVRKFFAVLFSVILFGNSLSRRQWFGTILVFTGLFADMAKNG